MPEIFIKFLRPTPKNLERIDLNCPVFFLQIVALKYTLWKPWPMHSRRCVTEGRGCRTLHKSWPPECYQSAIYEKSIDMLMRIYEVNLWHCFAKGRYSMSSIKMSTTQRRWVSNRFWYYLYRNLGILEAGESTKAILFVLETPPPPPKCTA